MPWFTLEEDGAARLALLGHISLGRRSKLSLQSTVYSVRRPPMVTFFDALRIKSLPCDMDYKVNMGVYKKRRTVVALEHFTLCGSNPQGLEPLPPPSKPLAIKVSG